MHLDLIKGILNSNLSNKGKIAKIERMVERAEIIENMAIEIAYKKGRRPTIDDHLKATKEFLKKEKVKIEGLDKRELKQSLNDGIAWLKKFINQSDGWRIESDFTPCIVREKPSGDIRPIDMFLVSPWEISMTVLVLVDWILFFDHDDKESLELIEKGNAYLRKIQSYFGNGALGDSVWIKGMRGTNNSKRMSAGNNFETCIAVCAWILSSSCLSSDFPVYKDSIEKSIRYLKRIWNKKDGGWGFKSGWKSDIKCTSFSFMVLVTLKARFQQTFSLGEEEFKIMVHRSLEWILERQDQYGSWEYYTKSRDNSIFGAFYAIEALNSAKNELLVIANSDEFKELKYRIDVALAKALRWYESSYKLVRKGSEEGWCWENHVKSSGIENTAASLTILLDSEWLGDKSHLMEKTVDWILRHRHPDNSWGVDTPLVLMCLMRVLEPNVRLYNKVMMKEA